MPSEAVLLTLVLISAKTQHGSSSSGLCVHVLKSALCALMKVQVCSLEPFLLLTFRNLRKNIRVVVTVSASSPKLLQWMTKERPSFLRLMNVIHHRPWNQDNLLEVAELQLAGTYVLYIRHWHTCILEIHRCTQVLLLFTR